MLQAAVFCALVWAAAGAVLPNYNLTVTIRQNATGHYCSDVKLDHDGDEDWQVAVNDSSTQTKWKQTIIIYPGSPAPPKNLTELGYELVPGFGHYKLHEESQNWEDARRTCEQDRTHLLILSSDEEALRLGSLLENNNKQHQNHWVGFHKQGGHVTILNETLEAAGFSRWRQAELSGDCGVFYFDSSADYGLTDHDCTSLLHFICEKEATQ